MHNEFDADMAGASLLASESNAHQRLVEETCKVHGKSRRQGPMRTSRPHQARNAHL